MKLLAKNLSNINKFPLYIIRTNQFITLFYYEDNSQLRTTP